MSYCTIEDIKGQIPENILLVYTDDNGSGVVDEDKVAKAISSAEAEINSYVQTRYPVPVNPVPDILNKLAVDISIYNIVSRRGFDEQSGDKIFAERYKAAVKFLENVAKGVVLLSPKASEAKPEQGTSFQNPPRLFNRDSMKGF